MEALKLEDCSRAPDIIQELIKQSHEAKKNAFCPYSNFRVGAALLVDDGTIIKGCNIENASYNLGLCAERVTMFKAISDGHRKFKAIAIASDVAGSVITPCGSCRQIMFEFGPDMDMYMTRPDFTYTKVSHGETLPFGFGRNDLFKPKTTATENNNGTM